MEELPLSLRLRIEQAFGHWGRFVVRRPWLLILITAALTGALVSKLPEIRYDNSDDAMLLPGDPARLRYDAFLEQYGEDHQVVVLLRPRAVFDFDFLERLRALHEEIEAEVPYLEEVTSLVNARNTRGEGDELIVEDLLEQWPETPADLALLRERVFENPLFVNVLVTEDEEHTLLRLKPNAFSSLVPEGELLGGFGEGEGEDFSPPLGLSDQEAFAMVEALREVLARHAGPDLEIQTVGGPVFEYQLMGAIQRDASIFIPLSIVVIMAALYALFGRLSAMLLPILIVVSAMLSTMGLMVWLDIPFSVTLNMLPTFLLAVGVCDSIHLLTIFYRELGAGRRKEEAIVAALAHSGLAVVMTSLTTAAGLAGFLSAAIAPVAQLGLLAPAGVLLAMLYSLSLLPALLAVAPLRGGAARRGAAVRAAFDALLSRIGDLATRRPRWVVAGAGLALLAALPGVASVRFSHDAIRWLPPDDTLRLAVETLDREFKGAETLELLVSTGVENGLHEPRTLRSLEQVMRHSETLRVDGRPVNKAISLVDVVKETHQALNENRSDFYVLPGDRQLVAQELLLFENSGSDDLKDFTDPLFETARVTIRAPMSDALRYQPFLGRLSADVGQLLAPGLRFELTGGLVMFSRIFSAVIESMSRSYVIALLLITPMMILLIGSLSRGLVAMIPNLIPVYLVLALMGFTDIPLDMAQLLIGGIVIGLAVDDTIHFMHKFSRYYEESGDARRAVHQTLATTGSALLFTSLVLMLGFSILMLAYMMNTFWFGLLAASGIAMAFVADVVLAPALMVLVCGRRPAPAQGEYQMGEVQARS